MVCSCDFHLIRLFYGLQEEGIAYHGRALVEIGTDFDTTPEKPYRELGDYEQKRAAKYTRRHKFVLIAAFQEATMICCDSGSVEFEVSIGE